MAFNVYYAALGREDRMDGIAQVPSLNRPT